MKTLDLFEVNAPIQTEEIVGGRKTDIVIEDIIVGRRMINIVIEDIVVG